MSLHFRVRERTPQGYCSECGGAVMWDGQRGACPCGASKIPSEFVEACRRDPEPRREPPDTDEAAFHARCEAEEMVDRNPRWRERYGDGAFAAALEVAERRRAASE